MKQIREEVLNFMIDWNTTNWTTNQFCIRFSMEHLNIERLEQLENSISFESITRARRKIIADHGIGKRVNVDKESDYIKEYARSNKY
ncbi:MAG: hypothetical protein GY828_02800 [Candidatus Gracilibacteria bacterium]|nr:hypothetical protein [Candidatus Gracilibacteria bacterium]